MPFEFPSANVIERVNSEIAPLLDGMYRPVLSVYSRTLARALTVDVVADTTGIDIRMLTGFWWSIVLDKGRRGIEAPQLIYFRDITNDPRVSGGANYPRRYNGARKLSPSEFRAGQELNRRNPGSMVVIDRVAGFAGRQYTRDLIPKMEAALTQAVGDILAEDVADQIRRVAREAGLIAE